MEQLREEFLKVLREVESVEIGDLSGRKKPSCRGIRVAPELIASVDELIEEEWDRGEPTLWRLNCLVYAGAQVIEKRGRKNSKRPTTEGYSKRLKDMEPEIKRLRRKIGWMTSEISRRRLNQRPTARQYANIVRLHRMFGVLSTNQLKVHLDRVKGFLKVRSLQA